MNASYLQIGAESMNDQLTFILPEYLDRTALKAIYNELYPAYDAVLQSLYQKIRSDLEKAGKFPTIKYRVKKFDAYFDKLLKIARNEKSIEKNAITDILGLRIVCPFLEDLEAIEKIINAKFNVVELERKGSRYSIGEFGYESVHLLIKFDYGYLEKCIPHTADVCEIQLRTTLQDAWAEVEHELIYKSDITLPNESIRRKLASINATLALSDLIFQEIRDYQKEIRGRDRKRRQSLEEKLNLGASIENYTELPTEKKPKIRAAEIDSFMGQSNLEQVMLAALDAHSKGNLDKAVELYTQILRLKTKDSVRSLVYNHRGMAYFGMSDYSKAISDFSKAITYDNTNVRCYNNRALTLRLLKRFERSLEDYDKAIAINPSHIDSFWGRAQTFFEMKLYTNAIADCEKVLSIQSDFAPARSFIKRLEKLVF
jgi:putative GTP pyrophosphokinase